MTRRWPPQPRHPQPPGPAAPDVDWPGAVGDLQKVLAMLVPGAVLGEQTYALDSAGGTQDQYRAPFAALAVTSGSPAVLTIAAAPRGAAAPGPGPGMAIIPPRGFTVVNMRGYAWSLYGGNPGDLVTVQAFTRPQPPAAAAASPASSLPPQPATIAEGSTPPGPAAGTTVAATAALPAGIYTVTVYDLLTGTVTFADASNMQLVAGAAVIGTLVYPGGAEIPAPGIGPVNVQVPAGGAAISVKTIGAGSGTASYFAQIIATRIA